MSNLTKEQLRISARNRYKTGKLLNVKKGFVLHHIDEQMKYNNPERYILWLPEDLKIMTKSEHMSYHQSGNKNINCRIQFTPERLKKMSEVMSGNKNPNYGKHRTEETKRKISEANKGKKRTEEAKKKMSEAKSNGKHHLCGKKLPNSWKEKIANGKIGSKNPMAKKIINIKTNEVYNTIKEACCKYNISYNKMRKILKSNCGYWRYYE